MQIDTTEETDINKWENYLGELSGNYFLSAPFLEAFSDKRLIPFYLRFESGGKIIGLAAGLRVLPVKPLLQKIYSPVFLFSGAVVPPDNSDLIKECVSGLLNYVVEQNHSHLMVGWRDYFHEINLNHKLFTKIRREEYVIDLRDNWDVIRKRMRNFLPTLVRRAIKNGVTFHESFSPRIVDDLIVLMKKTKSVRLSKGYDNYNYFYIPYLNEVTLRKLVENKVVKGYYALQQDKIICMLLVTVYSQKAYALFIGADESAYKVGGLYFVYFNTIKQLKTEGFEYLNIGGVIRDISGEKLIYAKTSLGAEKKVCWGGETNNLNGYIPNLLTNVYSKTRNLIR